MLAFLMTYFLSLVILLGLVSRLLMVLFGCGIVLLIFLIRNLLGVATYSGGVAALVDTASIRPMVAVLRGSGTYQKD